MSAKATRATIAGPNGHLAMLRPFSGNSMTGTAGAVTPDQYGSKLPREWREVYRSHRDRIGISYTVSSYATPVAWLLTTGVLVMPRVRYSATTSLHQNMVRAWLHSVWGADRIVAEDLGDAQLT